MSTKQRKKRPTDASVESEESDEMLDGGAVNLDVQLEEEEEEVSKKSSAKSKNKVNCSCRF